MSERTTSPRDQLIAAAFWHGSIEKADKILAEHPELRSVDIHVAALLGDDDAVRRFIAADPKSVHSKSGPRNVDPLTTLCFSAYLRDESRSQSFVRAATALLDAGADINAGFHDADGNEWESLIYGAAGVAFHPELTRLLLERGIDPNDNETPYHSPETRDNRALIVLLESGKLTQESLNMMLLRKTDWHDLEGIRLLLDHGAEVNRMTRWGKTALHNAILSNNGYEIIDLLLQRGADPTILAPRPGRGGNDIGFTDASSISLATRRGRADVLQAFKDHGFSINLEGVESLIGACAVDDGDAVEILGGKMFPLRREVLAQGSTLLAEFAAAANAPGVGRLLDLGVPVDARYGGDGYFGTPPNSTALHVAAWHAWPQVVELLIARGADVNARDGDDRTPLQVAVRAATVSYWTGRRSPDSVRALLDAGASKEGISVPTGYDEIDVLLR
jgi:ankyrin repeat protein